MTKTARNRLDYLGRERVQTINDGPSETIQSDAHLADLNTIMRQFEDSGMNMLDETKLMFADVSEFTDLQDALNQARAAEVEFMKLPSKVREVFDHDVAVWLDSAHDEEKRDALVKAGFLKGDEEDVVPPGDTGGSKGKAVEPDPVGDAGGTTAGGEAVT